MSCAIARVRIIAPSAFTFLFKCTNDSSIFTEGNVINFSAKCGASIKMPELDAFSLYLGASAEAEEHAKGSN